MKFNNYGSVIKWAGCREVYRKAPMVTLIVWYLYYVKGLKQREIAELFDVPQQGISIRISDIKKALRKTIYNDVDPRIE